jgi:hypothetical protein
MSASILVVGTTRHIHCVVEPDCGFYLIGSPRTRLAEVQLDQAVDYVFFGMVGTGRFGVGGHEVVEDR